MAKSFMWNHWQKKRELGLKNQIGSTDRIHEKLYSSLLPRFSWDPGDSLKHTYHGGVFNLEFSPDGSLLVAATEKKSILVFDPFNCKMINHVDKAHNDCVNYARFLDCRMFATCSDDTTIALWDVRYLKHKIRSLKGHSNWVKNIEFDSSAGLLVTSGFDGSIYTWDINRYTEGDIQFERVFHTTGLMRMRLTPDNSKMVICTTSGYLMVIHNLDLRNLASDLNGFKPNLYRMLQVNSTPIPVANTFDHLFTKSRNKVELISDFPPGNDAEVISSLQIHPHGWCALSRNTSGDELSEWTCLHDIQEMPKSENPNDSRDREAKSESSQPVESTDSSPEQGISQRGVGETGDISHETENSNEESSQVSLEQPVLHIRLNYERPSGTGDVSQPRRVSLLARSSGDHFRVNNIELRISGSEFNHYPVSASISHSGRGSSATITDTFSLLDTSERRPSRQVSGSSTDEGSSGSEDSGNSAPPASGPERSRFFIRTESDLTTSTIVFLRSTNRSLSFGSMAHKNIKRLHHYIREPNVGRGFIKELCFSTDGRLICSPYGNGVRLLSYNASCSELCDCMPKSHSVLHEVCATDSHQNYVVSTKFSPTHCLLVSGCLSGKICFHHPYF